MDATVVHEAEHVAGEGVLLESTNEPGQAAERLAHVAGLGGEVHADVGRQRQHAATATRSRCSVSARKWLLIWRSRGRCCDWCKVTSAQARP